MRLTGRSMLVVAALALTVGGCAKQRDDLVTTNNSLQDQNIALQNELREARQALAERGTANSSARQLIDEYQREISRLESQIRERDAAIAEFGDTLADFDVALDPATDRALANLARQHSDLIWYDPDRGMLRFKSDLTFDSGSATLKDGARASLGTLAKILNSQDASVYVVEIVGHTDNQPMSAATRQIHTSNLHLSCHRAAAVHKALAEMGVSSGRMVAAGWGEHQPLVPNNNGSGTEANRRVEIYLTRDRWSGGGGLAAETGDRSIEIDRQAAPRQQFDPVK